MVICNFFGSNYAWSLVELSVWLERLVYASQLCALTIRGSFELRQSAHKIKLQKKGYCPHSSHSQCSGLPSPINQMWQGNTTSKLKWLVTNDNLMDIAFYFVCNLGDILSQQTSILGDDSQWILQNLRGTIFLELQSKKTINWKHYVWDGWRRRFDNIKHPTILEIVVSCY